MKTFKSVSWVLTPLFVVAAGMVHAAGCSEITPPHTESKESGCPGCACYGNGTCNANAVCVEGRCEKFGCSTDADCASGLACQSGTCIAAGCGNGMQEDGEACDDGNRVNGDGCNVRCDLEATTPQPDAEPQLLGSSASSSTNNDTCYQESQTGAFAPGPPLYVKSCSVSFILPNSLDEAGITKQFDAAQSYMDGPGSNIVLQNRHIHISLNPAPAQSDPAHSIEVTKVAQDAKTYMDNAYPNQCDIIIVFANSLRLDDGIPLGGLAFGSSPDLPVAFVTRGNALSVPGETLAHELGHMFGLVHTFANDGCTDTPPDSNCIVGMNTCSRTCPDGTVPPAENVMSYYHCPVPGPNAFSPCQIRRERCVITQVFPNSGIPAPVTCNGSQTQMCGFCGTQSRECKIDGSYGPWSACTGSKSCSPNDINFCVGGAVIHCNDQCQWESCPSDPPPTCKLDVRSWAGGYAQEEHIAAHGKGYAYDANGNDVPPFINPTDLTAIDSLAQPQAPCAGRAPGTCQLDTYTWWAGDALNPERLDVTAYGKAYTFNKDGSLVMGFNQGTDLTTLEPFATGPCAGRAVGTCQLDTYAWNSANGNLEITGYGKAWLYDPNWQPIAGYQGLDLTKVSALANGPCSGKLFGTCELDTYTWRKVDGLDRLEITAYGRLWYFNSDFTLWNNGEMNGVNLLSIPHFANGPCNP